MITKRQKRKILSLFISLLIVLLGYYTNAHPQKAAQLTSLVPAGSYRVVEFSDGDTITVDMNGSNERIRMIGVDTPETHDPRKPVQCFGEAASNFTKQLIGTEPVRLEADPLSTNRDRYGRLLRYVYLPDNRLLNNEIILNGYGFAYTSFPFEKSEEFKRSENEARNNNRGLWSSCTPGLTSKGYIQSNPQ